MNIILISVMTQYFFATLLILWWVSSTNRKQRHEDLRYHRNLLLERIHNELTDQERRLADHLRSLK
jgi:uncharacterized protein YlxW (UPF0749 family)